MSSKDKVQWGRRPPFIGGGKSNRYAHNPHRAVLPLVLTVLQLDLTVLPLGIAVLLLASGTKKILPCLPPLSKTRDFGLERYYRLGAAVVLLWSGSKKLHPLQFAVVPLQPFQNTKTATTFANGLRIR